MFEHADSRGNGGILQPGSVQRATLGYGMQHPEGCYSSYSARTQSSRSMSERCMRCLREGSTHSVGTIARPEGDANRSDRVAETRGSGPIGRDDLT